MKDPLPVEGVWPDLSTSRLSLRGPGDGDAEMSVGWRSDTALRDGALGYSFPTNLEAEKRWLEGFNSGNPPTSVLFSVDAITTGSLVGYVSLRDIDWISRAAEFGIVIGPATHRGTGLGGEATELAIRYAFRVINLNRLWLRVADFNTAAIQIYRDLGFKQEGTLRSHVYRNDAWHDVLIMGLLRGGDAD